MSSLLSTRNWAELLNDFGKRRGSFINVCYLSSAYERLHTGIITKKHPLRKTDVNSMDAASSTFVTVLIWFRDRMKCLRSRHSHDLADERLSPTDTTYIVTKNHLRFQKMIVCVPKHTKLIAKEIIQYEQDKSRH
jgi:hypothetical protein